MRIFNYANLKDYRWDSEILGLVAQIHEFKGKQELYLKQKPAALEKLVEIAKIQSTEASNKIEGIVTTSTRLQQLVMEKTTPRNRDEEEIMGYRDVLNTIHESYEYIPIRSSYILQLHRDLYQYSQKDMGGRFKNTQNVIAENHPDGSQTVRFTPLTPYETPGAIDSICDNFNQAIDACIVDSLVLIPIFINDFLCIHPFNDDGVIIGTRLEKPSKINGFALLSPIFLSHAGWREDGAVHINTYYTESQMGLCA